MSKIVGLESDPDIQQASMVSFSISKDLSFFEKYFLEGSSFAMQD
jgi:hypothetical protein